MNFGINNYLDKEVNDKMTDYDLAYDVRGLKILFVNVYMIGQPGVGNPWVLVDTGLFASAKEIVSKARELFGALNPPKAIILTHGHFDHAGSLNDLLTYWPGVHIYAHSLEIPFLTSIYKYPAADPAAGGGAVSALSWLYPRGPLNLTGKVFPIKGDIPCMEEWSYIHTPGHTPGHISLFRERDGVLIAGDAFVTTDLNSLMSVIRQRKEIHAPPPYFTINWEEAKQSVDSLISLEPRAAGTGHGLPLFGEELYQGLRSLLQKFEKDELPHGGYYTAHPIKAGEELANLPFPRSFKRYAAIGALSLFTLLLIAFYPKK